MVDAFAADNGATRCVPASHLQLRDPSELMSNPAAARPDETLARGPEGSLLICNGSVWHSHTAKRSERRRRSLQGHFVPRDAKAIVDHAAHMRPEVLERIGDLAKYVLAL